MASGQSVHSRTAASRRMLLLASPNIVDSRDIDEKLMDTTEPHRNYMKDQLYGKSRAQFLKDLRANVYCEAGDHSTNYADEIPPKWMSTSKADYTPKEINLETEKIRAVANYIKKAHFTLAGAGDSELSYLSTTKKDYSLDDKIIPTRPDYKEFVKSYSVYPPIFLDENHLKLPKRRDLASNNHKTLNDVAPDAHGKRTHTIPDPKTKSATHFTLGNDEINWESVTKSCMKSHTASDPVEYERTERKRSTVLDYPDMEFVPMKSVHQQDYTGNANVDRKSLIVDTDSFIKDLKSTHFTLGDSDTKFSSSQYQASFTSHQKNGERFGERILPPAAFPANKQCVIVEDFENRAIGVSSQKDDYRDNTKTILYGESARVLGGITKSVNSKSSVSFGLNDSGLSRKSKSVTSSDYGKPVDIDHSLAKESYDKGGVSRKPDIPFYDPINIELKNHLESTSVAKSDYKTPPKTQFSDHAAQIGRENKKYLRTHHFSLGELDSESNQRTMTHSHFQDPEILKKDHFSNTRMDAAGSFGNKATVASRAENDNYEKTLNNTISRYPYDNSTFQTVNSKTYKTFSKVEKAEPFRPRGDLVGEYLHPMFVQPNVLLRAAGDQPNTPIRELTTVTRRSYVPPEVMKFCQPLKTVGVKTSIEK